MQLEIQNIDLNQAQIADLFGPDNAMVDISQPAPSSASTSQQSAAPAAPASAPAPAGAPAAAPATDNVGVDGKLVNIDVQAALSDILGEGTEPNTNPASTAAPAGTQTPPGTTPASAAAASGADDNANPEIAEGLGKMQDFLIKSGIWVDYENRDKVQLTNESFADIAIKQAQYQATATLRNIVTELPEDAQRMLRFLSEGGKGEDVAKIFIAKSEASNLNPQTLEEKQGYIQNYYRQLNWSESRIQSHMDRIKAGGDASIESEFTDVKPLFTELWDSKLKASEEKLLEKKRTDAERRDQYVQSMTEAIQGRADLPKKDKELVYAKLFDNNIEANGQKVTGFFADFLKAQSNPADYIDLVLFLHDKKAYLKSELAKLTTTTNRTSFDFLSSNGGTGSAGQKVNVKPVAQAHVGLNWGGI